ncbi:MAG: sigma-70 family RNA polymerase sigma factor [Hyphomonadaceae bacterium]|nr:sigma-70 family RNA polymerase sigma factor [Hyphomonadaceae bacterium]
MGITLVDAESGAQPPAEMLSVHYEEFRRVARRVLNGDAQALQIQPTDLAHEAAIRIAGFNQMSVDGRTHFLSLSARVMRQILIDEIRRMRARKRQAPVETQWPQGAIGRVDLEALDTALTKLEAISPQLASIVERRFFAGLTLDEIAANDGISESTVKRQWRAARAWLAAELTD